MDTFDKIMHLMAKSFTSEGPVSEEGKFGNFTLVQKDKKGKTLQEFNLIGVNKITVTTEQPGEEVELRDIEVELL